VRRRRSGRPGAARRPGPTPLVPRTVPAGRGGAAVAGRLALERPGLNTRRAVWVGAPMLAGMTTVLLATSSAWAGWVDSAVRPRVAIARLVPVAGWGVLTALLVPTLSMGALPVLFVVATSVVIGRVPAAVDGGVGSAAWDSLVAAFLLAAGA